MEKHCASLKEKTVLGGFSVQLDVSLNDCIGNSCFLSLGILIKKIPLGQLMHMLCFLSTLFLVLLKC